MLLMKKRARTKPLPEAKLLSVRQTAATLGKSYHYVLELIRAGHLPSVRLPSEYSKTGRGQAYQVRPADLDALIEASREG